MLVLDTNHLGALVAPNARNAALAVRLKSAFVSGQDVVTTIVNVQETMEGWISIVKHDKASTSSLIDTYDKLHMPVQLFKDVRVLSYDTKAARICAAIRKSKQGSVGLMDLRIGAIALANDATVLTTNLTEFRRIPDLIVENWLE